jgi:cytochrome c
MPNTSYKFIGLKTVGIFVLAFGAITGNARAAGNIEKGANVFKTKCAICHSTLKGKNKIGPSLHALVGRKAATAPKYSYSSAMRKSGLTWDEATLNSYLKAPRKKVKGTKMSFPGLGKASQREDIIAYLKTLK